jgi:DNA-binding beta-propeller fold protein YncE
MQSHFKSYQGGNMKTGTGFALLFTALFVSVLAPAQPQAKSYRVVDTLVLGGEGGRDYCFADTVSEILYVSRGSRVQVVDLEKRAVVGEVAPTPGVHGIAIASTAQKGYISNGRDSSVTIFDTKTFAVLKVLKIGARNPDAILYEPSSNRVFTFNGGSANATAIDVATDAVVGFVPLGGKPEFSVFNNGIVYVNIEDKSEVVAFDPRMLTVLKRWSIAPGEEPSGLALDNQTHRLFSVCGNKLMMVIDAISGKVITSLPIGDGCDGAAFDPQFKRVYASNGEGTLTVVQIINESSFKVLETVPTQRGARTIALDKSTHHIYLPTAEFEAAAAGSNQRPSIKPNTFTILDIATLK